MLNYIQIKMYKISYIVMCLSSLRSMVTPTMVDESGNGYTTVAQANIPIGVTVLSLANNAITTIGDGEFSGYTALVELDLSSNSIISTHAGAFTGVAVVKLDLSSNTGLIDLNLLTGLSSSLEHLVLDSVSSTAVNTIGSFVFTGLLYLSMVNTNAKFPDYSGNTATCNTIQTLILSDNNLNTPTSAQMQCLTDLRQFDASENSILAVPDFSSSAKAVIETIDLSTNSISTLTESAFSGMVSLTSLKLADNSLDNFPNLQDCSSLQTLDIQFNGMYDLEYDYFTGLTALEELNLDSNYFNIFPDLSEIYKDRNNPLNAILTNNEWTCDCDFVYALSSANGDGAFRSTLDNTPCYGPPEHAGKTLGEITLFHLCGYWPETTVPPTMPSTSTVPPTTPLPTTVATTSSSLSTISISSTSPSSNAGNSRWLPLLALLALLIPVTLIPIVYHCKKKVKVADEEQLGTPKTNK